MSSTRKVQRFRHRTSGQKWPESKPQKMVVHTAHGVDTITMHPTKGFPGYRQHRRCIAK